MEGIIPKHTTGFNAEVTQTFAKVDSKGNPIVDDDGKPELTTIVTGSKNVRRLKNHTFKTMWETAETLDAYTSRVVKAQRLTVERLRMTHKDDIKDKDGKVTAAAGSSVYTDAAALKYANSITLSDAFSKPKSKKTDSEKLLELFNAMSPEEQAGIVKAQAVLAEARKSA